MSKSIPIFGGGYTSMWRAQDFCRRGRAYMQNGLLHFYPEARKAAADDLCNEYYDYRIVNRKATLPGGPRTPQFQCLRGRNLS
jgi:hypothetical protein